MWDGLPLLRWLVREAAADGDIPTVALLLGCHHPAAGHGMQSQLNELAFDDQTWQEVAGTVALPAAAEHGQLQALEFLLGSSCGADPNAGAGAALAAAAAVGRPAAVAALLRAGADPLLRYSDLHDLDPADNPEDLAAKGERAAAHSANATREGEPGHAGMSDGAQPSAASQASTYLSSMPPLSLAAAGAAAAQKVSDSGRSSAGPYLACWRLLADAVRASMRKGAAGPAEQLHVEARCLAASLEAAAAAAASAPSCSVHGETDGWSTTQPQPCSNGVHPVSRSSCKPAILGVVSERLAAVSRAHAQEVAV